MTSTAAPSPEPTVESIYERLSNRSLSEALGIKGNLRAEQVVQRLAELRRQVAALAPTAPPDVVFGIVARLKEIDRIAQDPLELFVHAQADTMKQDPADPKVRGIFEAEFLAQHLPKAVWLMTTNWGGLDSRAARRYPLLCAAELTPPPPAHPDPAHPSPAPARVTTENLSTTGVRLVGVPAELVDLPQVCVRLLLADDEPPVTLNGNVVWKGGGKIGVHFSEVGAQAKKAIEIALLRHYGVVKALTDRCLGLAPHDATAIACAAIARFFATEDPTQRRAQLETVAQASNTSPNSAELHLAYARLALAMDVPARARAPLKRARERARDDPRVADLDTQVNRPSVRNPLQALRLLRTQLLAGARGARIAVAVCVLGIAGAVGVYELRAIHDPVSVPPPAGGLPCATARLVGTSVSCVLRSGTAVPERPLDAWASPVARMKDALHVKAVLVFDAKGNFVARFE